MSSFDAGTGVGRLILDSTGVAAGVAAAGTALSTLNDLSQQSYFQLRNLGMGFEAVGAAAAAGIGIAVDQAMNWQQELARISATTMDATASAKQHAEAMNTVEAGLRNIANTTPTSISAIMGTANAIAQQGIRGQQLVDITKEVIDVSNVLGVSQQDLIPFMTKMSGAFGLSTDGVQRFGNALVSVATTSTASLGDIETFTQRLLGAGAEANMTLPQIIGLSAGIAGVGGQARQAASAFRSFIEGVVSGANQGGNSLTAIGRLTDQTGAQFQQAFSKNSIGAIDQVIEKLGELRGHYTEQINVLSALGVSQLSQQQAIIAVVNSQQNEGMIVNSINDQVLNATAAWEENNRVQNATEELYKTTSAQLDIFKNKMDLAAQGLGAGFLPILNVGAHYLSDFTVGIANLPGPVKFVVDTVLVLAAGIGILGGAMLLVGPRIMQAWQALQALVTGNAAAKAAAVQAAEAQAAEAEAAAGTKESTDLLTAALNRLNGSLVTLLESMGLLAPETEVAASGMDAAAGAATVLAPAEDVAAVSTATLGAAIQSAIPIVGPFIAILGLATVAVTAFGAAQDSTKSKVDASTSANEGLAQAMHQEAQGTQNATAQWLIHQMALDGTLTLLKNLKITAADAVGTLMGTASAATSANVTNALAQAAALGGPDVRKQVQDYTNLRDTFQATTQAVQSEASANLDLGASADTAGAGLDNLAAKSKKTKDTADLEAKGAMDLVQANLQVESSSLGIAQAQEQVRQAAEALANKDYELRAAQDDVAKSTADLAVAQIDLANKERAVVDAVANAQEQYRKDQLSLADAQVSVRESTFAVTDAQAALAKVMAGVPALDEAKAINALHDAQTALLHSSQDVADAQWQLNYLMQEGAGAHDIQNAQLALADAQNKQADASAKVGDSQQKITDLNAQYNPEAVAKAQDALTTAIDHQQSASLSLHDAQTKVKQDQIDLADNSAYLTAVDNLVQAHSRLDGIYMQIHTDQQKIQDLESGQLELQYQAAVNNLHQAVVNHATALSKVDDALAEMHGSTLTAVDDAANFAKHLGDTAGQIGGPIAAQYGALAAQVGGVAAAAESADLHFQSLGNNGLPTVNTHLADTNQNFKNLNATMSGLQGTAQSFLGAIGDFVQKNWNWVGPLVTGALSLMGPVGSIFGAVLNIGHGNPGDALGNLQKLFDKLNPLSILHLSMGGMAEGPDSGHMAMLHGRELVLPMNDTQRSLSLLASSGLLGRAGPSMGELYGMTGGGGGGSTYNSHTTNNNEGDTFNLTAMTNADPSAIMDEYFWKKRTATK